MNEIERIREISPQDLMVLGREQMAYVKQVDVDGQMAFAVYAADGTHIAVMASRELAFATIRQHNLEPASVH